MFEFPKCLKCNKGVLVPLSDYGIEGATVVWKAWACISPNCRFMIRVDKGDVTFDRIGDKRDKKNFD